MVLKIKNSFRFLGIFHLATYLIQLEIEVIGKCFPSEEEISNLRYLLPAKVNKKIILGFKNFEVFPYTNISAIQIDTREIEKEYIKENQLLDYHINSLIEEKISAFNEKGSVGITSSLKSLQFYKGSKIGTLITSQSQIKVQGNQELESLVYNFDQHESQYNNLQNDSDKSFPKEKLQYHQINLKIIRTRCIIDTRFVSHEGQNTYVYKGVITLQFFIPFTTEIEKTFYSDIDKMVKQKEDTFSTYFLDIFHRLGNIRLNWEPGLILLIYRKLTIKCTKSGDSDPKFVFIFEKDSFSENVEKGEKNISIFFMSDLSLPKSQKDIYSSNYQNDLEWKPLANIDRNNFKRNNLILETHFGILPPSKDKISPVKLAILQ